MAAREEAFLRLNVRPAEMDHLWAEGWRHFGIYFFRYRTAIHGHKRLHVLPLRVDLQRFILSRSQKRVIKNNRDCRILIRPAKIDAAKNALFAKHRLRFTENIPGSLQDFLSPAPAYLPCPSLEICVYLGAALAGATFLDVGESATSGVYAIFDPAYPKRSLGILMMLQSIQFSVERGCRYYYPGYAYREPFAYDYKKRLAGLEYLDWDRGWQPYWPQPTAKLEVTGRQV